MSKKRNDWKDEHGAVVLAPQPVKRRNGRSKARVTRAPVPRRSKPGGSCRRRASRSAPATGPAA
jgi:hypothetical protein